jgi:hypothetical protein
MLFVVIGFSTYSPNTCYRIKYKKIKITTPLVTWILLILHFLFLPVSLKIILIIFCQKCKEKNKTNKLRGPSPLAKYTDRATAACRRGDCQLFRIEGATSSA